MKNKKYNLTFWQRVSLPFLWLTWATSDPGKRKSWHHVKKGIEKHEHRYTIYNPSYYAGRKFDFWDCDHEGCNYTSPDKTEPPTQTP